MNTRNLTLITALALGGMRYSEASAQTTTTNDPAAPSTAEAAVKKQTQCPVMGGPINKNLFVDVDGKRIYVCCGGCIAKVKKDPAKYVKQLEEQGITLDKAPEPDAKK